MIKMGMVYNHGSIFFKSFMLFVLCCLKLLKMKYFSLNYHVIVSILWYFEIIDYSFVTKYILNRLPNN